MSKKYKQEDNVSLRKAIEILLIAALQEVLKIKLHHRVLSSSIMHTDLSPEGDMFTVNFVIEVHEKKGETDTKNTPPGN